MLSRYSYQAPGKYLLGDRPYRLATFWPAVPAPTVHDTLNSAAWTERRSSTPHGRDFGSRFTAGRPAASQLPGRGDGGQRLRSTRVRLPGQRSAVSPSIPEHQPHAQPGRGRVHGRCRLQSYVQQAAGRLIWGSPLSTHVRAPAEASTQPASSRWVPGQLDSARLGSTRLDQRALEQHELSAKQLSGRMLQAHQTACFGGVRAHPSAQRPYRRRCNPGKSLASSVCSDRRRFQRAALGLKLPGPFYHGCQGNE